MGYGSTACQHAKIKEMFLTAVTWWEIDTGYRPRKPRPQGPLGQTAKQEDSGDEVEGPAHTFSISLEKGYFFSIFLQYSCSLTNRVYVSPSTFISFSV